MPKGIHVRSNAKTPFVATFKSAAGVKRKLFKDLDEAMAWRLTQAEQAETGGDEGPDTQGGSGDESAEGAESGGGDEHDDEAASGGNGSDDA